MEEGTQLSILLHTPHLDTKCLLVLEEGESFEREPCGKMKQLLEGTKKRE